MLNRLTLIEILHNKAEITIEVEESIIPIEGNALASGDPMEDAKEERWIKNELFSGNTWAWADVTVKATWKNFVGVDTLGGCSYLSEEEFKSLAGYYGDMVDMAVVDLADRIIKSYTAIREIVGI